MNTDKNEQFVSVFIRVLIRGIFHSAIFRPRAAL